MKRFKWKSRWSYHHPIDSNKKNFLLSSFSLSVCVLRARVWVCCECLCRRCRCRCRCVLHIAQCFVWTLNTNTVLKRSKNKFNLTDKHTSTVIAQPATNAATITERTKKFASHSTAALGWVKRERGGVCVRERELYLKLCVVPPPASPPTARFVRIAIVCFARSKLRARVEKSTCYIFFFSFGFRVSHTYTNARTTHKCATYSWVREPAFFFCVWRILASEALLRAVCHQAVSKCERNSKCQKVSTDNNNNNSTAAAQHQYYCNQRGTKRERATKSEHVMLTLLWVRRVAVA